MIINQSKKSHRFFYGVKKRGNKVLLITDSNVAHFYLDFMKASAFPYLILPAGEKIKSRAMKIYIEDYLLSRGYLKDTELIAFGGGVISDLVGFVAATYMRGVIFSIIPTTIICMADASIGGKNGINTPLGKNLIGSFYHPVDVCLENSFFKTLDKALYKEQFSEIVKIALTSDRELFFSIKDDPIGRAREIKARIVEADERERGERKILNFGHTFAHAYEKIMKYKISHGKAVWMGVYFASFMSFNLGVLPKDEWEMIKDYYRKEEVPISYLQIDKEAIYEAMLMDKKNRKGSVCFILLSMIGEVYREGKEVVHAISKKRVLDTLISLVEEELCVAK